MERNTEFEPIPLLEPLVCINEDIVNKMSTDSMSAWKYLQAVVKGKIDSGVVDLKCGKLCHSRSLMCGMSCQVENHALNLGSEDMKILKMFATWATQVYLPMFYEIKVKHEIKYGPWHLVKLFRLWNQQDETIKDVSNQYQKKSPGGHILKIHLSLYLVPMLQMKTFLQLIPYINLKLKIIMVQKKTI